MKPPKEVRSEWPQATVEMVVLAVGAHEVIFADSLDIERRTNELKITRGEWLKIGNPVALMVGVWK